MKYLATKNLHRLPKKKPAPPTVPKIRLYVERPERQETWFVNVGHVTDRGRWRTEAHAHPAYGQVIFVRQGGGMVNLEGTAVAFEGPCALVLPTECVHGLDYANDADRWVVTIEVSYLAQVNRRLPEFTQLWALPRVVSLARDTAAAVEFHALIRKLAQELEAKPIGHIVATEALLVALLLTVVRAARLEPPDNEGVAPSAIRLAERFRELIEQHYRQNWPLQNYASTMAVSPAQLRSACAAATGLSPIKMIHARLITEAKRNLIFGDLSVEQIAYSLGFSDTAYFTRFFRREVGQSPSRFRSAARHHGGLAAEPAPPG